MNLPTSAIAIDGDARRADLYAAAERTCPLNLRSQPATHPNRIRFGLVRRTAGTALVRDGMRLQGTLDTVPGLLGSPTE
jgi:hypothetical protein